MVNIWSVAHYSIDQIRAKDEHCTVRVGDETLELLQCRLEDIGGLLAILNCIERLEKSLNSVGVEHC